MTNPTETDIEQLAIEELQALGYHHLKGSEIAPSGSSPERESLGDVLLSSRLRDAIRKLNPHLSEEVQNDAFRQVIDLNTPDLLTNNRDFHTLLTDGVPVRYRKHGEERGERARIIDFQHPHNNDFVVVNQYTIIENNRRMRPDLLLFVNGIPLVVIELKSPSREEATIRTAYNQLQTYKATIPTLFTYNALLVISDGLGARAGSLSARFERFMSWKSVDGENDASSLDSEAEPSSKGSSTPRHC